MRPTTLNPKDTGMKMGSGRRKCWGCNIKEINQWCVFRWWPQEMKPNYRFRAFRKVHLLPTCRRENWDYPERNEFVEKYCKEVGIDHLQHMRSTKRGGKRGGRVAKKPMMI